MHRVVPFQVDCSPVPQVHCLPVRIVAWPKCSTITIKLIGKDKYEVFVRVVRLLDLDILGGITVNETEIPSEIWNLSCSVDSTEIEASLGGLLCLCQEVGEDGIAFNKCK